MSALHVLHKLLEDKNYWCRKYLACNEAFIQALKHAPEVAIDELELFYGNRESLLKILEKLDARIEAESARQLEITAADRTRVQAQIREKDSIVSRIVALDSEIIQAVEQIRVAGEEKIRLLAKGKKALAKYKSTANYNEKIDKRV